MSNTKPIERALAIIALLGNLHQPRTNRVWAVVGLAALICGCGLQPNSRAKDIRYYQALKLILSDVRENRGNPAKLTAIVLEARQTCKEIANDLKNTANRNNPAQQLLLWAARDEFPRAAQGGFATETNAEKAFASRLQDAAYELGLETRTSR